MLDKLKFKINEIASTPVPLGLAIVAVVVTAVVAQKPKVVIILQSYPF